MVLIQIDIPDSLDIALKYYMNGSGSKDKRKAIIYLLGKILKNEHIDAKQKEYIEAIKERIDEIEKSKHEVR